VGGPAAAFVEATDEAGVHAAFGRSGAACPHVLGGGSNVVIADEGIDGLAQDRPPE
jgi:UDP-N-acetylenolpyruvoylglucosamine reductase